MCVGAGAYGHRLDVGGSEHRVEVGGVGDPQQCSDGGCGDPVDVLHRGQFRARYPVAISSACIDPMRPVPRTAMRSAGLLMVLPSETVLDSSSIGPPRQPGVLHRDERRSHL